MSRHRLFFLGLCLSLSQYSLAQSCLTPEQHADLEIQILCQQLQSPLHCEQLTTYYQEQQQAASPPLSVDGITGAAVLAATRVAQAPPIVRRWVQVQERMRELGAALTEASRMPVVSEAIASRISRLLGQLQEAGGGYFSNIRNLPSRVTPAVITSVLQRAGSLSEVVASSGVARTATAATARTVGGAARVGSTVLGVAFSWPVAVGLLIWEVGNIGARVYERYTGCTAEVRNSFQYMCVTERCHDHHLNCPNILNFAAADLETRDNLLNANPRLCQYMQDTLGIGNETRGNVTLNQCPQPGETNTHGASITIRDYRPADLRSSNPEAWNPENPGSYTVNAKFLFEGERLNAAVVDVYPPFSHATEQYPDAVAQANQFYYARDGQLQWFSQGYLFPTTVPNVIDDSVLEHVTDASTIPLRREALTQLHTNSYDRETFTPPPNIGFAGLAGNTHRRDWPMNQSYLLHSYMGDLFYEVRRCCQPQEGETCRLSRGSGHLPAEGDVDKTPEESAL